MSAVDLAEIIMLSVPTGGLSLAVEGPSKAEISCKDNKDGTCTVSYLPTAPGDYNIIVKFDDKHIPGSPFTAKITGTRRPCSQTCETTLMISSSLAAQF